MRDAEEFLKNRAMDRFLRSVDDADAEEAFNSAAEVLQGYLDRIGDAVFPVPNTDMPFLLAALELHLKELRRRCGDKGCKAAESLVSVFQSGICTVERCLDGKERE